MTPAEVAADYRARHQERAAKEQRYFEIQRSLSDAIEKATLARMPNGGRFKHQRRLSASTLATFHAEVARREEALRMASDFREIHRQVSLARVAGVGPLTVFDAALRIAAHLRKEPDEVYLHAGTTEGAKRLGLSVRRESIPMSEIPEGLRDLRPREVEDCLCIYKSRLQPHE